MQPSKAAHENDGRGDFRDSVARCVCDAPFSPGGDKGATNDDIPRASSLRYDIARIRAVVSRQFKDSPVGGGITAKPEGDLYAEFPGVPAFAFGG